MEREDSEMPSAPQSEPSRSTPEFSAPDTTTATPEESRQSVSSTPPTPPPLPLALPAPSPPILPDPRSLETDEHHIPSFVGTLEGYLRSAVRQTKWALVLILPRNQSISSPSSPTHSPSTSPRPAWGPGAYHQPKKLYATKHIADNVMLWRRTAGSQDAERYTAFFPTDGHPHVALLDPRSGERLAVWGNVDAENMIAHNSISDDLWNQVLADVAEFLKVHSLADGALGPAHHCEKSWAVRTRRVTPSPTPSNPPLQSTAIMDNEDAAIAAAIAASLAESQDTNPDEEDDTQTSSSEEDYPDNEDERDETYSSDSMTQDDEESPQQGGDSLPGQTERDSPVEMDFSSGSPALRRPASLPMAIPSRGRDPTPSSVESLSSSYIDRMESCLRSSTDPALLETRRLRQEQDAELARSLHEDRRRIQEEEAEAAKRASQKAGQLAAEARLPDEPLEGSSDVFTIAIRLPGGVRIARRFNSFDKLISIADFAIAKIGCEQIVERAPAAVLKMPGLSVTASSWDVKLSELSLSSRTMFILNAD